MTAGFVGAATRETDKMGITTHTSQTMSPKIKQKQTLPLISKTIIHKFE